MMPLGFSAQRVKSTQPVILGNFTSEYVFDMMSESDEYISIKNSYMSVNMQIWQVSEVGAQVDLRLQPIVNSTSTATHRELGNQLSIPYINPNPIANLWQTVTADIAGQTICNIQNVAPVNTLYRMLFESKQEQATINGTNKLSVMGLKDIDCTKKNSTNILLDYFDDNINVVNYTADTAICSNSAPYNTAAYLSNRQLWALENLYGFNRYNEVEVNGQLPVPLGYCDELIPPNTPISLRFQTNTNFATDIVNIAGSAAAGLGTQAGTTAGAWQIQPLPSGGSVTLPSATGGGNENVIYVGVKDITIWLARVRLPSPVSSAKLLGLKQFSSLLHAISQSNHDEFIVETKRNRRVSHICIAFTQPKNASLKTTQSVFDAGFSVNAGNTTGKVDGTNESIIGANTSASVDEAPVYINSPITNLSYLRVEFGGSTMPQTPYNFNFNWTTGGKGATKINLSYDVLRAYNDYLNATDAFRDRAGCLLSFDQWIVSPIFVFKTHQVPNADTSTALVSVDFNGGSLASGFNNSGRYNCLVMCLYDEAVQLTYDQFAHLTSVVVA